MAKLKAPLLSLGASGAIGKTMVFFGWKGLDVVREYVIPSNPQTTGQTTQRGYLTEAVSEIHKAEAVEHTPLKERDKIAYSLYGSTFPTPRTWFNQIVQRWLVAKVQGEVPQILTNAAISDPAAGEITIALSNQQVGAQAGYFYAGTSKTSMPIRVNADGVAAVQEGIFTGLTSGVKYFFQFRPTKVSDDRYVARSGIYNWVAT